MKHEDIIRMAREAGITFVPQESSPLSRFAAFVAAAEREACAKFCEEHYFDGEADFYGPDFAAILRARGQT